MVTLPFESVPILILLGSLGCSGLSCAKLRSREIRRRPKCCEPTGMPLQRARLGEPAYDQLHPDLKTAKFNSENRSLELQVRRLKAKGLPKENQDRRFRRQNGVTTWSFRFDLLAVPARQAAKPVAVIAPSQGRKLRKCGDSWRLATHDLPRNPGP